MTQRSLLWIGIIIFLFGLLGFIPNFLVGNGIFASNMPTGVACIIVGVIFIFTAYSEEKKMKKTSKTMSIILIALALIGFLESAGGTTSVVGFAVNGADSWALFVLGIFLLWISEKNSLANPIVANKSRV